MDANWANITGGVGLALNAYSLTRKADNSLRVLLGVGLVVWALNNWLLAAYTASALCLVAVLRQLASVALTSPQFKAWRTPVFIANMLLVYGLAATTWQGWPSILTAFSATLSTTAMYYCSGIRLRAQVGLSYVFWAAGVALNHAWWGVFANLMLALVAFVVSWRAWADEKANKPRATIAS